MRSWLPWQKIKQSFPSPLTRKIHIGNPNIDTVLVTPVAGGAASVHCTHIRSPPMTPTQAKDVGNDFACIVSTGATWTLFVWTLFVRTLFVWTLFGPTCCSYSPRHMAARCSTAPLCLCVGCVSWCKALRTHVRTFLWPHRQSKFRKF